MSEKKKNITWSWLKAFLIAVLISLFFRAFIIQSFSVQSTQMKTTLLPGDYIIVNKLKLGSRLPITLLSLPFFPDVYNEILQLPYFRIPGYSKFARNEIIAFNYPLINDKPIDKKDVYVKRLVGLPGDTVQIYNKKLQVNSKQFDLKSVIKYRYRIVTDGTRFNDTLKAKYDIENGGMIADMGIYDFALTPENATDIKKLDFVNNVRIMKSFPGEDINTTFPESNSVKWNKDYFGPVIIPSKGASVKINLRNIDVYKRIIDVYEDNEIYIRLNNVYINGKKRKSYTFKKNYYFVIDDNRDFSNDSRGWGFLPEDYIIGDVSFVWFSKKPEGNIRWNRIIQLI